MRYSIKEALHCIEIPQREYIGPTQLPRRLPVNT
jgi:hypothetical protein